MRIVICGGGIIGVSTAYFLLCHEHIKIVPSLTSVTIVERNEIAGSASGKAGGFLARDWSSETELGCLSMAGFDTHMQLAELWPGDVCEYRRMNTFSVLTKEDRCGVQNVNTQHNNSLSWLDSPISCVSSLGSTSTTAQVNPYKLVHKMLSECNQHANFSVSNRVVSGIEFNSGHGPAQVSGVWVDGHEVLPADVVLIAMGPWSLHALPWFSQQFGITSRTHHSFLSYQRAHSILIDTSTEGKQNDNVLDKVKPGNQAIFLEMKFRDGSTLSPEIYPRPNNTVYMCGLSDTVKLPENPTYVEVSNAACDKLKYTAGSVSDFFKSCPVIRETACYLPLSSDGLPLIGVIPNTIGCYIATGHSCWGILNGPITGKLMSEFILDGAPVSLNSTQMACFDPARFKSL